MVYHRLKSSLCLFSYFSRLKLINDGDYTAATQDAEMLAVLLGNEVRNTCHANYLYVKHSSILYHENHNIHWCSSHYAVTHVRTKK